MPTAGHVQVSPDSTGKEIDAQQLTSTESGQPTVLRQTITVGDTDVYGNLAKVTRDNRLQVAVGDTVEGRMNFSVNELLFAILEELSLMREAVESMAIYSGPQNLKDYKRKSVGKDWSDIKLVRS